MGQRAAWPGSERPSNPPRAVSAPGYLQRRRVASGLAVGARDGEHQAIGGARDQSAERDRRAPRHEAPRRFDRAGSGAPGPGMASASSEKARPPAPMLPTDWRTAGMSPPAVSPGERLRRQGRATREAREHRYSSPRARARDPRERDPRDQ